jgi:transcriptional regulator with XRE-family HTH domain
MGRYNPPMETGEQLRKIREFRGLTLSELAKRSGVGQSTLSQWESGKHKPRFEQLKKVLDALGITHEQLYEDFDDVFIKEALEKYETSARDIEVVLTANPALSPAEVEVIMRIVESKERELAEKEKGGKPE